MHAETAFGHPKERIGRVKLEVCRNKLMIKIGAIKFHIAKSTFFDLLKKDNKSTRMGRPPVLNEHDEATIIGSLLNYADFNVPLSRSNVLDAIEFFVKSLAKDHKRKIIFINNSVGHAFMRGFAHLHKSTF